MRLPPWLPMRPWACARGAARFGSYLGDPLWRELFGLDVQAASQTMRDRLIAIPTETWLALAPLGQTIDRQRDARFLLAEAGPKAARRALAMLARAITCSVHPPALGFPRRLRAVPLGQAARR